MKTSKKLLSLFLAVVMVVTTCSVGFTAFAEDGTATDAYWTDQNNTDADDAFESLNNLVDYFVPTLLGIKIGDKTLADLLNIKDKSKATLSDIVKGASPLLMGVLGVAKASDDQKKQIIMDHLGVKTYSGIYDSYFSYLNNEESAISFFDLYQFCKENKANSTNTETLGGWCNVTLTLLDGYLDLYDAAAASITTAEKAYDKLSPEKTIEKTAEKKYNGIAYADLADPSKNPDGYKAYQQGIDNAKAYFEKLGVDLEINTAADALYYYYSNDAKGFVEGLSAVYLAEGKISSGAIESSARNITTANVMQVLTDNFADYSATHTSSDMYIDQFLEEHLDIVTEKGITYNDGTQDITLAPVKDMTAEEAEAAGLLYNGKAYPLTGWPVKVDSIPPTSDPDVQATGGNNSPLRAYFYYDPVLGKVDRKLKNNAGLTTVQQHIATPYYEAYLIANSGANTVEMYGNMIKDCYMDIAEIKEDLYTYGSTAYDVMVKNALKETGLYDDVDKAIEDAMITDDQIKAASKYFQEKDLNTNKHLEDYLKSSDCAFSKEASDALLATKNGNDLVPPLQALANALNGLAPNGFDSTKSVVALFKEASFTLYPYTEHGITTAYDATKYFIPAIMLYNYIGSSKTQSNENTSYTGQKQTANVPAIFAEIYKYNLIAPQLNSDSNKYHYAGALVIPDDFAVAIVNRTINGYINTFLDPNDETGKMISDIINNFLEADVDLKATLTDIWQNLADDPIATVFKLLPTVVVLLDEVIVPLLFNQTGDAYNGVLYSVLCKSKGEGLQPYTLEAGNAKVGITTLSFDLNKLLPGLLAWFDINDGSDESKEKAFAAAKAYVGTYDDLGYDIITENNSDGSTTIIKGKNVLAFTGIYTADKALMGANLGTSFIRVIEKAGLNHELATGINEIVAKLCGVARDVIEEYLAEQKASPDIKYTTSNTQATEGLNDIFVALPQILDKLGKRLIKDCNVDSDWAYCYEGKIYADTDVNGNNVRRNKAVQDFKAVAKENNSAKVLEAFVNIFIGDQLNAVLDLFNDIFADDENEITKNIPIVQGLLAALGGFGETSIITDLLDGFFQMKRCDKASFELKQRETTNFVGFSTESGIYLIANLFSKIDGKDCGIVPFVLSLIKKSDAPASLSDSFGVSTLGASAQASPYLVLSNKNVSYRKTVTSANKKAADKLISKLDTLLSSLLKNTTINGFDLTATDSILSGVVSAVSNYIGENNTNALVNLVDLYLQTIVGDNDSSKNGKVDANKVYTSEKLSTIVIETYALVEDIAEYLLKGALGTKDPNGIITGAICGIISPDAVGVRMSDDYSKTAGVLLDDKNLTWNDVKTNERDLKYGFSKGSKTGFYDALGESLSGIAAMLGVVLTSTYTDAEKSGNYYSELVYPIFSKLADATGASGVMAPAAFNKATAAQQLIKGIITPVSSILEKLYEAPASFLLNAVKGLAGILEDKTVTGIITGAIAPINFVFEGVESLIALLSPTLSEYVKGIIDEKVVSKISITLPKKNVFLGLICSISVGGGKIGDYVQVDSLDWNKLAKASSPSEVLLIVYAYLVDNVLSSNLIKGLLEDVSPALANAIAKLSAGQILNILNEILEVTQSPTEVYWSFSEYSSKLTNTFSYPKNISKSDADKAVDQLDDAVAAVFALLNDLNVVNIKDLGALVNDNLYTNKLLTTMATGIYGAIEKSSVVTAVLQILGFDLSPAGFAEYLMDSSYGKTYSDAAKALKKAKTWDKVKTLNWGFKDGSAKAEAGFVAGIAAIARPINGILAVLLAENGEYNITAKDVDGVVSMLKTLNIDKKEIPVKSDSDFGCILNLTIKNGVLTLVIDSNNSNDNSTVKVDLPAIVKEFLTTFVGTNGKFGTNGYESAIVPILEAFMCDGVKTYKQYLADYKKAKDNLLIDILTPITGFIGKVTDAPFDTVTKILPNVAYFIDSNGLTQAIGNLLAPITAKNGVIGILAKNGIDVDQLIKAIAGKSLGKIVTDALDINVKLTLDLGNLKTCNIQDIVIPLVNKILKSKLGISLPKFDFATIASHGKLQTVKSAAKNTDGKYTTKRVVANQGEVLIAVLRYVADTLIKNATPLKKLIGGIDAVKKNKTILNVVNSVFNQIKTAAKDDIVRGIFYFLCGQSTDRFFDYSNFVYKDYEFSFGEMDEDFCRQLAPMLDGLINGLLEGKGGLNGLIGGLLYKDDLISKLATGLYGAVEGVSLGKAGSLTNLLAHFDIDFSTANVASLLTNEEYGKTYPACASVIKNAGSWKKVKPESLKWGVTDRESFENALCAVLRPIYGMLDVFLNDGKLNLANIAAVPGSNCYTSVIVPLLEAFGCYNIKTHYQYREDMAKAYDAILLDILNPLLDKVEDILYAPIEMVADMLPNLALFFANDGLLQIIDNLLVPVSALLEAIKPIVNVNDILNAVGLDLNKLTAKAGLNLGIKLDLYDLQGTLKPLIGADNVVGLLNKVLGIIKIKGKALGIELPDIDWLKLASHGEMVLDEASQAATIGSRMYVKADQDETLIAVLRFLIDTVNYKGNYDAIVGLVGGLLGGLSDSIAGVVDQVLGMLKGDSDTVIKKLVELLQQLGG